MTKKSELQTDIFNYHTPEFFINMKSIPDKKSSERAFFVLEEKKKCREGININGIYIPGSLYFHLNYYHLEGDDEVTKKKKVMLPRLRDNEWIIFNDYEYCQNNQLVYLLFGARQIAKSEIETSLCLRELSVFKQTEALALFSGQPDKDTFVKKMSTAITHGEKFIIVPNIDKDWSKEEIRFGFTKIDNSTELRSRLYIYNTQEGKKIQVGSGKSVSFLLMDEIGKAPFRSVYDTIEPALLSDFGGLRCAPILAFTGGETEKARDARNMVENPNKSMQFTTIIENAKEIGGRFISGLYRKDCKEEKKFSEFIGKKTNTWLDDYPIFVSNFNKSQEKINKEKEDALKSPDKNTYTLKRIFFPLNLDDVFLTESNNNFPVESIKPYIEKLNREFQVETVELYKSAEGKIKTKSSDKEIITKFPVEASDNKDAPICIAEKPIDELPFGAYVGGLDPYNENESSDRINSLGALYIFKRIHDPLGEYQYSPVAWYVARPKTLREFKENCLLLMEYYNAYTLIERSNTALIDWFIDKGKGHLLADGLDIAKEINPKSSTRAVKGLQPTAPNQRHGMDLLVEYTKEEFEVMTENDEIREVLGFTRIKDPMLLTEMVNYRAKPSFSNGIHDGNFDRICAFYHAVILAKHLDKYSPVLVKRKEDDEDLRRNVILHSTLPIHKSSLPNKSKNIYLNSPFRLRR